MPTARVNELVTGREIFLEVDKSATETPSWVTVGCAKSIDFGGAVEALVANCQSGKIKTYSGEDADYDASISGFVFYYSTGNVATNVSAAEFEGWMNAKTIKTFRIASTKTGDPVRTFPGIITNFRFTAEVAGLAEYTISIMASTLPTLTAQV